MIKLAVLITQQHRMLSVAAILDVFESVNRSYRRNQEDEIFSINLLAPPGLSINSFGRYSIQSIGIDKQDLILIPAFDTDDLPEALRQNGVFLPWLDRQFKSGAEIGSFCTGAFLLAASGLLNGRRATTHIDASMAFAANFPEVKLEASSVVTDDNGIYTSGGATSSFHLMLHLIERYCARHMALQIAKLFAIDMDREQQSYFGTFSPPQNHGDDLVSKTQRKIESSYQEASTIEQLIKDIPASRRNVVRRFKQATGVTPIEYLQKTRIEAAKRLLEQTNQSILEVMLNSGYNDMKAFRQVFKKSAGVSPKVYRDKFNGRRASTSSYS
jgi:transcriptional regulator GlxA family with amidase domain